MASGEVVLRVSHDKYAPVGTPAVSVPAGAGDFELGTIRLAEAVTIEGQVSSTNSEPLAGVAISVQANRENPGLVYSDQKGSFVLTGLTPRRWKVEVSIRSSSPPTSRLVVMSTI